MVRIYHDAKVVEVGIQTTIRVLSHLMVTRTRKCTIKTRNTKLSRFARLVEFLSHGEAVLDWDCNSGQFEPLIFVLPAAWSQTAHFTDAHLFAQPQEQYWCAAQRSICNKRLAAAAAEAFDFVVFGGDLTQDHSPESYQLFAELVANSGCSSGICTGNHDELSQLNAMTEGQIRSEKRIEHAFRGQVLLINSKGDTPAGWVAEHHFG